MPRYIDADRANVEEISCYYGSNCYIEDVQEWLNEQPTTDVVEIETLKAWLYEIAMNNVGCNVDDFASACEEIASRLDGLRAFAGERRNDG